MIIKIAHSLAYVDMINQVGDKQKFTNIKCKLKKYLLGILNVGQTKMSYVSSLPSINDNLKDNSDNLDIYKNKFNV